HGKPGRLALRVEHAIHRLAEGYVRTLEATLPFRFLVIGCVVALVAGAGFVASRLPSTFFPDIDEAMERIYVRFAPGTSLEEASHLTDQIGKRLSKEIPPGNVELVLANVGSPNNARSAMNSPNWGPYMGFIRLALADPEKRTLDQQQLAD